jgi:hypothetical protein
MSASVLFLAVIGLAQQIIENPAKPPSPQKDLLLYSSNIYRIPLEKPARTVRIDTWIP